MDEKTLAKKWTRADRINFGVAVGACLTAIAALFPDVVHLIDNIWQAPHATINEAAWAGFAVKKNGPCPTAMAVSGTADHIPAGDDLWLVARSNKSVWYPVHRINIPAGGSWEVFGSIGTSRITELDLRIFSQAQDGQFVNYMNNGAGGGFSHLPPGPPPLSRWYTLGNEQCQFTPAVAEIIRALTRSPHSG
jgi:hypothetical protein